jgi:hypothetical protein
VAVAIAVMPTGTPITQTGSFKFREQERAVN